MSSKITEVGSKRPSVSLELYKGPNCPFCIEFMEFIKNLIQNGHCQFYTVFLTVSTGFYELFSETEKEMELYRRTIR